MTGRIEIVEIRREYIPMPEYRRAEFKRFMRKWVQRTWEYVQKHPELAKLNPDSPDLHTVVAHQDAGLSLQTRDPKTGQPPKSSLSGLAHTTDGRDK